MTDGSNRPLTKTVDLGWSSVPGAASNALTLLGMADLGNANTDSYALSLTYNPWQTHHERIARGEFGVAVKDARGKWINAVDQNSGGSKSFVLGPWNSSYGLGTYGVDPHTRTAWAVVNYNSEFAAAEFSGHCQKH